MNTGFNIPRALAAGTVFFLVTGAVTGLIPNDLYVRMVPITILDYFFLFTTSVLAAVYFGAEKCSAFGGKLAGIGGVTGFLAFGCPICNVLLMAFFSTSAVMTYFDPLRPFLGVVSTLMLGLFIYRDISVSEKRE